MHVPPALGQLTASLKDGGLKLVQAEDIRSGVLPSIEALLTTLDADHPEHRARLGGDRYSQAVTMVRTVVEALRSLIYMLITARRRHDRTGGRRRDPPRPGYCPSWATCRS